MIYQYTSIRPGILAVLLLCKPQPQARQTNPANGNIDVGYKGVVTVELLPFQPSHEASSELLERKTKRPRKVTTNATQGACLQRV